MISSSCAIKPGSMFVVKKYCLHKALPVALLKGLLVLFNLAVFVHLLSLGKTHNSYQSHRGCT